MAVQKQKEGKTSKIRFYKFVNPQGGQTGKDFQNAGVVAGDIVANRTVRAVNSLGITINSIGLVMQDLKSSMATAANAQNMVLDDIANNVLGDDPTNNVKPKKKKLGGLTKFVKSTMIGFFEGLAKMGSFLFKAFVARGLFKWMSYPKNLEKLVTICNGIKTIGTFLFKFVSGTVGMMFDGLGKMFDPEAEWWKKIIGFGQFFVGLGGLLLGMRWLKNPLKLVEDMVWVLKTLWKNLLKGKKKLLLKAGLAGIVIGGAMMLLNNKGEPKADGSEEGGHTINGNPVTKEDSIEISNIEDRLESLENEGLTHGDAEYDKEYKRLEALENKYANLPEKAAGGWISGPQSGYPVSLSKGGSADFIGHGLEFVAPKRAGGGFVVPFDTPATRRDPGLTGRRIKEAGIGGYDLGGMMPGFSKGGILKALDLKQFSEGGAFTPLQQQALGILAKYESGSHGYEAVNQIGTESGRSTKGFSGSFTDMNQHGGRSLTDLTIGEIKKLQFDDRSLSDADWIKQGRLHAVGKYQFIGNTLPGVAKKAGIPDTAKFSSRVQDTLALQLMKDRGIEPWVGPSDKATKDERAIIEKARQQDIKIDPALTNGDISLDGTESDSEIWQKLAESINQVQQYTDGAQLAKEEAKIKIRKDKEDQITAATLLAKTVSDASAAEAASAALEASSAGSTVIVPNYQEPEILGFNPKFGIFAS